MTINRLCNTQCYLIGAMDRVSDGGITWRRELIPWLKNLGIEVFDPTDKKTSLGVEDENSRNEIEVWKNTNQFDKIRPKYSIVREIDLRYCDKADFSIARIDVNVHACGSYEEIFWMNRAKHPVLVWSVGGKHLAPNWLFFTLPHQFIFSSLDEIKEYLLHINSADKIDLMNRWKFLYL